MSFIHIMQRYANVLFTLLTYFLIYLGLLTYLRSRNSPSHIETRDIYGPTKPAVNVCSYVAGLSLVIMNWILLDASGADVEDADRKLLISWLLNTYTLNRCFLIAELRISIKSCVLGPLQEAKRMTALQNRKISAFSLRIHC